jgi:hypothetical protein
MKSAKVFAGILLFISFSFTNCSRDQDYLFTTNEIITRGDWGVTFFADKDKTVQYEKYVFHFSADGILEGTDGIHTAKGNWNVIRDVDRSDLLTITLIEQNNIRDLSNAWSVKAKTTEAISLQVKGNSTEFRIHKL